MTVRAINYTDFRVTRFSEKSFLDGVSPAHLDVGRFYFITMSPKDNFKVKAVEQAEAPARFLRFLEALQDDGIDGLEGLMEKAERLHYIKRGTNDFFKSKTGVKAWLVGKYLKTADARMNATNAAKKEQ